MPPKRVPKKLLNLETKQMILKLNDVGKGNIDIDQSLPPAPHIPPLHLMMIWTWISKDWR